MEIWDAYDKEGNLLGFDLVREEKYRYYVECLERYVGWLALQR